MKLTTSTSTSIHASMNSPSQANKINSLEVSSAKKQYATTISNDTIAKSSQ
ncbi:hypothetical protein RC083_10815 [Pseudoalteromonas haloplanktis]|uniref:Orphan protein n=1 Tax=Pseudoalteromonas haloplanktis TaxID=228 RepID=A0ABU1BC30_PSEHA|nr:hypothetical protein [Pseudoalteromonas haloplanktis]MDQ9092078.1 hypothetical protein [Pseudoalteromonas haloplanktis]